MISFTVPCVPIAQPRQRHRVVVANGKAFASNYTPEKDPVNAFKASVRMAARAVYTGPPLSGAVLLQVIFIMPRPGRLRWKKRPMPRCRHTKKPDLDNLEKSLKDALSRIVWHDDSQVAQVSKAKYYAAGDEQPHVEVCIEALPN